MVVHDLNVPRAGFCPSKAKTELTVYPNTVLSGAITDQRFKPIAWRNSQVLKIHRDFKLPELAPRNGFDVPESLYRVSARQGRRVATAER